MAREAKLRVRLLAWTKNPEQNVVAAIRQCYSAVGASGLKKKTDKETRERLIKQVLESGHTSTIEHASFTLAIEGISRACSHQLVRHRIASYSHQSQRYVSELKGGPGSRGAGMEYIMPPKIKSDRKLKKEYKRLMNESEERYEKLIETGVNSEDARFILPNACETKIVVTMNARSLLNFFQQRCCSRAQWEIRALANEILRLVKKKAPLLFANAGPTCASEKICWEGKMSCGKYKSLGGELRSRI